MWQSGILNLTMLAPRVFVKGYVLSKASRLSGSRCLDRPCQGSCPPTSLFGAFSLELHKAAEPLVHLSSTGKILDDLTGHCKTARKAAVAVLRGNGGTFPSQAHMSDPRGVQERAEGTHSKRVILQGQQCVKLAPFLCPKSSELSIYGNP